MEPSPYGVHEEDKISEDAGEYGVDRWGSHRKGLGRHEGRGVGKTY